jgi:hypothetical protein
VIEEGAYADILLVEGNPLEDITVIGGTDSWFDADPEFKLIPTLHLVMKGGKSIATTLTVAYHRRRSRFRSRCSAAFCATTCRVTPAPKTECRREPVEETDSAAMDNHGCNDALHAGHGFRARNGQGRFWRTG